MVLLTVCDIMLCDVKGEIPLESSIVKGGNYMQEAGILDKPEYYVIMVSCLPNGKSEGRR